MRRVSLAVVIAVALTAGAAAHAAKLTAAQIVAKNVAARGGLEAWRKTETMIWVGQLQSARAPVPNMPFVLEQKRPNKTRFEINGVGQRTMRVFDGVRGWKVQARREREAVRTSNPIRCRSFKFASAAQAIDGPLIDYQAKGGAVTLEGTEMIEGRKAYHLDVTVASGEHQEVWVDAQNFLDIRMDRPSYAGSGTAGMVPVYYRNYKPFEGLQIPTTIEIGSGTGTEPDRMQIERVVINAPLDDRTFERPGEHRRNAGVMNSLPNRATPRRVIPGLSHYSPNAAASADANAAANSVPAAATP